MHMTYRDGWLRYICCGAVINFDRFTNMICCCFDRFHFYRRQHVFRIQWQQYVYSSVQVQAVVIVYTHEYSKQTFMPPYNYYQILLLYLLSTCIIRLNLSDIGGLKTLISPY
jgi:hypothetical protein